MNICNKCIWGISGKSSTLCRMDCDEIKLTTDTSKCVNFIKRKETSTCKTKKQFLIKTENHAEESHIENALLSSGYNFGTVVVEKNVIDSQTVNRFFDKATSSQFRNVRAVLDRMQDDADIRAGKHVPIPLTIAIMAEAIYQAEIISNKIEKDC